MPLPLPVMPENTVVRYHPKTTVSTTGSAGEAHRRHGERARAPGAAPSRHFSRASVAEEACHEDLVEALAAAAVLATAQALAHEAAPLVEAPARPYCAETRSSTSLSAPCRRDHDSAVVEQQRADAEAAKCAAHEQADLADVGRRCRAAGAPRDCRPRRRRSRPGRRGDSRRTRARRGRASRAR